MIPIPPFLVSLASNKLVWYVAGVILVSLVSFVKGCSYGQAGKDKVEAEFRIYREQQGLIVKGIQENTKQDAIIALNKLRNQEREAEEVNRDHKNELAKLRKKLDAVTLDRDLVRLLNDSALGGRKDQPPAGPKVEADGRTDEAPGTAQGIRPPTLGDLAEVTIENNKNHLACVRQVEAWQEFYTKLYERFE